MVSRPSQCLYCARWNDPTPAGPQTCTAFPDGIPDAIWSNAVDHRTRVEGDLGLQWKPGLQVDAFPEWAMRR